MTDDAVLVAEDFPEHAVEVMERTRRGALHVRGPGSEGARVFRTVSELGPRARDTGWRLLVNDRVDVALAAGLDGVHLGQRSLHADEARRILGPDAVVGVSVHSVEEATEALGSRRGERESASFLIVGPVFPTGSHPHRAALGAAGLAGIARRVELPVIAIGGVTPERVQDCLEAGAHGVAVLSGVWAAPDPGAAVEELARALEVGGAPG